jgi:hypothetical protein
MCALNFCTFYCILLVSFFYGQVSGQLSRKPNILFKMLGLLSFSRTLLHELRSQLFDFIKLCEI